MSADARKWVKSQTAYPGAIGRVLAEIADVVSVDYDWQYWVPTTTIAERAHCGRSAVTIALARLVADGVLTVVDRPAGRPTRYRLEVDATRVVTRVVNPRGFHAGSRGNHAGSRARSSLPVEEPKGTETTLALPLADRSAVERVFDAWCDATGHLRAVLSTKRRRLIEAAVKSHGIDDALDAVRGWRHSAFHCGENDRATVYNSIELLLRDAEHIERFRDLERDGPPRPAIRVSEGQRNLDRLRAMEAQHDERRSRSNGSAHDRNVAPA